MYEFRFADIGEGIHEGQILKWFFKEGDTVKEGETLCLVETDKVNAEIPSPITGKIVKLNYAVGDTVHVGDVLVVIDDGKGEVKAQPLSENKEKEEQGVIGEIEVSNEVIESSEEAKDASTTTTQKVLATPVARKLAKDLGVDITQVKGTGPMGRVMKEDIIRASQAKQEVAAPETSVAKVEVTVPKMEFKDNVERVKISKLRKTIAKNMSLSVSVIPHTTSMTEFDVTKLVAFRKAQKEMAQQRNISLTYLPFIVKAVVLTLKEFRIFNASFDQENEEIIYKNY
ncbi:MAG: 2-oxo acid dehydrogenase subunit E2, partial [Bacilli bacterium]|nr:2-oxo acid dehydrogenase subunit E2 [Bacilli bacterium]